MKTDQQSLIKQCQQACNGENVIVLNKRKGLREVDPDAEYAEMEIP